MIDLKFTINRGDFNLSIDEQFEKVITGIYGPSGAGKTSLLKALSGIIKPQSGRITIDDKDLLDSINKVDVPIEKRGIAYVFQEGRLFPHLNVEQNLRFGMENGQIPLISFTEVVDLLALTSILGSSSTSISGGQQQRVAIGRALLSSPKVLLLDEPFSALDQQLRRQIIPYLIAIQQRTKIPVLVVSHDIVDLLRLTNRLCIINDGTVLGHGDYHELLSDSSIADLLGYSHVLNVIDMNLESSDHEHLMTYAKGGVKIKSRRLLNEMTLSSPAKVLIFANDISLSNERLDGVSFQNQLRGEIVDLFEQDQSLLAKVDVGFDLLVEITHASRGRLSLRKGREVWCLFKSVAVDVMG